MTVTAPAGFRAAGVAAGPDLAAGALHAVDQLPVEIADLRRQLALAEIVIVRRRRLVVGEVEDAGGVGDLLVDGRLVLAGHFQRKGDVLAHRHMRIERV